MPASNETINLLVLHGISVLHKLHFFHEPPDTARAEKRLQRLVDARSRPQVDSDAILSSIFDCDTSQVKRSIDVNELFKSLGGRIRFENLEELCDAVRTLDNVIEHDVKTVPSD